MDASVCFTQRACEAGPVQSGSRAFPTCGHWARGPGGAMPPILHHAIATTCSRASQTLLNCPLLNCPLHSPPPPLLLQGRLAHAPAAHPVSAVPSHRLPPAAREAAEELGHLASPHRECGRSRPGPRPALPQASPALSCPGASPAGADPAFSGYSLSLPPLLRSLLHPWPPGHSRRLRV